MFVKKLVVFDLDGTLHHTEYALAPAIAAAISGVTGEEAPDYERINQLYGEPLELFCKELVGKDDPETLGKFRDGVKFYQKKFLPTDGRLYPGIIEMLTELAKRDFDLAVLSNAHLDYIVLVTETLGIRKFFTQLVGRDDHPSKTERLKKIAASYEKVVMVGDRYHDIQAGLENKIPVIACAYGYGSAIEHQGALIAHTAGEVLQQITNL